MEKNKDYGWGAIILETSKVGKSIGSVPIYQVGEGNVGAGYFSKDLINKMMLGFRRSGRTLTDLYISSEDYADVCEWANVYEKKTGNKKISGIETFDWFNGKERGYNKDKDKDIDQETKDEVWDIKIHETTQLGAFGLYNINGSGSKYGEFIADSNNCFNSYSLINPNITAENGTIIKLGETQILGFDSNSTNNDTGYFGDDRVMLFRSQRFEFFSPNCLFGPMYLDTSMFGIGIIDRSL